MSGEDMSSKKLELAEGAFSETKTLGQALEKALSLVDQVEKNTISYVEECKEMEQKSRNTILKASKLPRDEQAKMTDQMRMVQKELDSLQGQRYFYETIISKADLHRIDLIAVIEASSIEELAAEATPEKIQELINIYVELTTTHKEYDQKFS